MRARSGLEAKKVRVSTHSDHTYIDSIGSSYPQSCCAASIWIKLSCRRITIGRTTESTLPHTGRDRPHFVVKIRQKRQCQTSGLVWSYDSPPNALFHVVLVLPAASVG